MTAADKLSRSPGVAILLVVLATGGCQSFEQRFSVIESRQNAIEAQLADLQSQQQTLIARVVQVRQELDNALQPLRTQSADRGEDLRGMRREVTALEEQIALLDERIGRLTEQIAAGGTGVGGEQQLGTPMPPPRGARAPTAQPSGATEPEGSEATNLYNSAFTDYTRKNYELCVQGFEEYIRRYGASSRAAEAQYWIGECEAARGNVREARAAFQKLIQEYPDSDKIPDAMFRDAVILKDQNQIDAAAAAFRRLIEAYPTGDAAFLACRQLDQLGVDKPAACEGMD